MDQQLSGAEPGPCRRDRSRTCQPVFCGNYGRALYQRLFDLKIKRYPDDPPGTGSGFIGNPDNLSAPGNAACASGASAVGSWLCAHLSFHYPFYPGPFWGGPFPGHDRSPDGFCLYWKLPDPAFIRPNRQSYRHRAFPWVSACIFRSNGSASRADAGKGAGIWKIQQKSLAASGTAGLECRQK